MQNEFRRFGMDIVAASVRRAQEQGYGADLDPEHTAAAIALLFENFTTVFVGPIRPRARDQRRGRHRDAVDDLEEDAVRVLTTTKEITVDFALPEHLPGLLAEMDAFIEAEIKPLERENMQYFDQRREYARTDWDNGGIPRREWEDLLGEMRRRADKAGLAALRPAVAVRRPRRHQHRHGRHPGTPGAQGPRAAQRPAGRVVDRRQLPAGHHDGPVRHRRAEAGVDRGADHRRAVDGVRADRAQPRLATPPGWRPAPYADGDGWVINGAKRLNTGVHRATHDLVFARTSGEPGQARGITAFLVPTDTPGFTVPYYWWTFNMPTDHGEVELKDVRVPADAVLGEVDRGLEVGQTFLHENRIRQAASSLGAAQYCIDRAVGYAERAHGVRQAAVGEPGRAVAAGRAADRGPDGAAAGVLRGDWQLDRNHHMEVSDKVSMANYRANRLVCEAADRAMQVFGGVGYSRHEPFEHIYRHHRRYRITEGAEEIQIRRVAQRLFGFGRK